MHFGVSGEWRPKWKEAHPMGEPHAVNVCATEGVGRSCTRGRNAQRAACDEHGVNRAYSESITS